MDSEVISIALPTPTTLDSKDEEIKVIIVRSESAVDRQAVCLARDKRNPLNFSKARKCTITVVTSFFTFLVSTSAVSFTLGAPSLMRDLHCTAFDAILGLSLYLLGFGLLPLMTSALSEEFGRQPLYYVSIIGFLLTHLMAALSQDIRPVLVARFLQGAFGSTGVVTVAGTIADIWSPHERGKPMSFYSLIAFAGNAVGGMAGGWIEVNSKLGWRWIQWIHVIAVGVYFLFFVSAVKETRISVILRKEAKTRGHTSEESGSLAQPDVQKSLREMLHLSCTRPIVLVFTEPIVFAISLWIGFAWGVYYCMIGSIPGVFRTLHRFNQGQVGSVYLIMGAGSVIGFFTNMYQEKLYQKNIANRGTQARLYMACVAGFLFPLSMFIFAWSSSPSVPWPVQAVTLIIYIWAVFTIYLAVFTYLADCYGPYASSALAGQSLFRSILGTVFPLFSDSMFGALGYKWANTTFACVALVMSPIPVMLFFYGPKILAMSRVGRTIAEVGGKELGKEQKVVPR